MQVANDAQISQTLLSRLEHGQNDTTLSVASGLARALGVEVIELFAEEETNPTMPQPLKA